MANTFHVGDRVNVPFMVDAYGTIEIVPGIVVRIYNTFISVELTGKHQGYTLGVNHSKITLEV